MRLQSERTPNSYDGSLRRIRLPSHQSRAPVGAIHRYRLQSLGDHLLHLRPLRIAAHPVVAHRASLPGGPPESFAPLADSSSRYAEPLCTSPLLSPPLQPSTMRARIARSCRFSAATRGGRWPYPSIWRPANLFNLFITQNTRLRGCVRVTERNRDMLIVSRIDLIK